ncbi:dumpy [Carabus blaptoides fortunei]
MASSIAVRKGRKHKMRLITDNNDDQMVVKSLSIPPGLEALMEGLTREVLRMQPQDICLFASEHFAKLIKMRDVSGDEYQFCKTTIHDKIKQKNVPSRVTTVQNRQPCPKDDVETFDGVPSSPRLTNGVSPEIKRNISEASTAEIDKIQAGFFNSKPDVNKTNEHANADDEIKEKDNATMTGVQIKENKAEAEGVKSIEPAEHDDSESRETKKDDDVIKGELAKTAESNTVDEDNTKKKNQIQEETKEDTVKDKEVCKNIDQDAVTKEIPNEEGHDKQQEETSNEVIVAHDECEEPETINLANKANKENEEKRSNIREAEIEQLGTADKAELHETEKKDTGNNVEESKLEATEEHDDQSDSNDVVTQETEQEMKTISLAHEAQIPPMEENTENGSSLEDKPVSSNDTEVKPSEGSTEAKLVDDKRVADKSTENEFYSGLEKAVINEEVPEKDSNKTPGLNSMVEDIKMDSEHNIRKRSVSQADEHEVQSLTIPEISTTVATPTPSEDGSTSADNVNLTSDEKQTRAATKLQSFWRGYSLRKMRKSTTPDNEEKSEDLHKLSTAATVIQSLWRGYSFRKSKALETSADETENTTSHETSPSKETGCVTDEQNIAATKIQSSWRGHNFRKKRHIEMNEEEHDKTVGEEKPGEEVVGNDSQELAKEVMAATVIQALWRGYAMRKSRNLESTQRNTDVDFGKLNLAATKIQSLWRGHNYRKVQSSSTVVGEHEMPVQDNANEKEDATTVHPELDAGNKTDTNITESDKTESKITELDSDKINDTVEPEIEVEKANEGESGNIAETTDSAENIEGVPALPTSHSEDKKTTEEIDSGSKTDADVPELQNEPAKTSDENPETTENNDEPKSEGQSEEIVEKSELVVKPEEITKTDDCEEKLEVAEKTEPIVKADETEGQAKSIGDTKTTEPIVKADETEGDVKSEGGTETTEPIAKADETEDQAKSEVDTETTEPIAKADETEGDVKSVGDTETTEPIVKADETEGQAKSVGDTETTEPIAKADETEGDVKSVGDTETIEPIVKADETEGQAKSVGDTETTEPIVKADETEGDVKSVGDTETTEPIVKANETEGDVKSVGDTETTEPIVKADETEGQAKSEGDTETTEPIVKADETEGQAKSEEDTERTEPIVKAVETEGQAKSEGDTETTEPIVKADETVGDVKSVGDTETTEPIVKADETEDQAKSEGDTETTEPIVKADESVGDVKSVGDTETTEPIVKADETEGQAKSEGDTETTEPIVKADETVGDVKSVGDTETTEPIVKADETEGQAKSEGDTETTEPIVKADETVADETEDQAKSVGDTEATEPIVKADETEGQAKSEADTEKSEPIAKADETEGDVKSVVYTETTEPIVKADETEGQEKSEGDTEKIEPIVKADETEGQAKLEVDTENTEPIVNADETEADETEGQVKSKVGSENTEPIVKADETEGQAKSEGDTENTEPIVNADETEGQAKSEGDTEKTEAIVNADETEGQAKSEEGTENIEPIVNADETEGQVKSEGGTENTEPIVKTDKTEGQAKLEVDTENTEPIVNADETEGQAKSEGDTENTEPIVQADESEGDVKSVIEPVIKEEVSVEKAEPKIKSDEFTETSESAVKPEEIVEATKTEDDVKSENVAELSEPAESKYISETTENNVKPGEISEPEVKAEATTDKVEPSVVDETSETGESSVSDKNAPVTTTEEVIDSTVVKPDEIANISESVLQTNKISETTEPDGEDNEFEKTVKSETDAERNENLHEGENAPVTENITQELAEKVERSPTETENENDTVPKTELHSDKEIDSAGGEVKETEDTHASDNNVNELDGAKTISDSENLSETTDNNKEKSDIIPGAVTENVEVKNTDITDKTEAGDKVEISVESPQNTTITTPSEDMQSEVEHASEITKNSDNLSTESPEIAVSDAVTENKEPKSTVTEDEGLKEQSATISDDSTEEKSTKFDENNGETQTDIIVEDKLTNDTDNEETNKDVTVNTDAPDITETQGTKNAESDTNEEIDTKENVTEALSPHSMDETQVDVDKHEETTEPKIKKESVEVNEARPVEQIDTKENVTEALSPHSLDETQVDVDKHEEISEPETKKESVEVDEARPVEQIDTKENVTEALSPHSLDETQVDVDKHEEIPEPEIKKESVEVDEARPVDTRPSDEEEHQTDITYNIASDKSSDEEKMNETDEKSTNDSISDIPSEAVESSEVSNENKSDISEPEKISADDHETLVKTENIDHIGTPTEVQSSQISNDDTSTDNAKQDVPDEKAELEDSVKENVAATRIQSTWRGYNVRKSNNIIIDTAKSENDNEAEDNVEKSSEDTGRNTEINQDETTKPTEENAEKAVEALGTAENNINETPNTDEIINKVENIPDETAKEYVAKEISEAAAEKIEHSSVNSENIKEAGRNDASEINHEETVGEISEPVAEKIEHSNINSENINEAGTNDVSKINNEETIGGLSSTDENKLEDTVTNDEAVPATKTAEVETAEHVSDTSGNKEDTSTVPVDEIAQQELSGKLEETSLNSTDNKAENEESRDKLEDDLEKHVEHDAKLKEENAYETDSRAEDHKDTYQASEASTVDIRDVEDSLKSPIHAEDSNDLEINVHEDAEKLNESSDTKNSLDADNKVKFYVGPDETNRIQIVDDETENHVTESDKLIADKVANEKNNEIHKSVTSVLLTALSADSEELSKDEATKEANEADEHQNDTINASSVNSSTPNAEEHSNENTEDSKENPTENAEGENTNETQDNQYQNSTHNNTENHTLKSADDVSNIEKDKSNAQKLAMNVQNFDKALSEDESKEKESNSAHADVEDESVTHKDDTEDTTSVIDTQNASTIPQVHENSEKSADAVEEANTATETLNVEPHYEEQHVLNSENKSESVQHEDNDLCPTNLHEEKSSESVTKDSNDAETTQDTAEGVVTPVEQHENVEAGEATTHTLLDTTAKDIAHQSDSTSPSDIIEDKGTNEHESEETHEVLHTPGTTTAEGMEIPHKLANESPVNDEDKHSVDKVDNDTKNEEDGILHGPVGAIVEDMPHESQSSANVNTIDKNKNVGLDESHSPVVTAFEDNQNEQMEDSEEKDTDKNIEESKSGKLDETSVVPSTEDIKNEGNNKSEHLEENINDIKKISEENEHVTADSNNRDEEPVSQDIIVDDKENGQLDIAEDKDAKAIKNEDEEAKANINEDSTVDKNENALISNEETHSEVEDMKEANKIEDRPEDEIKIKDIESQIEHDITDDNVETKQNDAAMENEENNTATGENSPADNEKSVAVTEDEKKIEEDKAAVKIQSAWKGYHNRQGLKEDKELALLQRPTQCDELPSKTDVAEDADVLSQAATTIQAGARGYLVRKRRHLARVTDVPQEKADTRTVDESDSVSQETVIEKRADTSQSFQSTENTKSEEENAHDGTPNEETQARQDENQSTITAEGTKDVESNTVGAETSKTDEESIMECGNDNDVKKETEMKDVNNEKANVAESSEEINESLKKHTHGEEETANKNDTQELDEIDALNSRLQNLNRSNVYQTDEEKKPDDKVEDDHKPNSSKAVKMNFDRALSDLHAQISKSSDDDESVMTAPSNSDDSIIEDASKRDGNDRTSQEEPHVENTEVAQILTEQKANTTPGLSVNLDDFDSSKYDLKVEHATPRSKNTSPVHELTSAAYKIGAAIAVDSEAIVDTMDDNAKEKSEGKPVEYIHIPLQGPLPEKIEKETLKSSQEHVTSDKNKDDDESPEYIYIPLKPPGIVDEADEKVDEGPASKENVEEVDNQKEDVRNETDTIAQCPRENKEGNEDNLKAVPNEDKEDSADRRTVLEENKSNLEEQEHDDAKEIHETSVDHASEKECDNETEQISKLPEPLNKSSELLSHAKSIKSNLLESKSPEVELSQGKSLEPVHSVKLAEKSPELSESQPTNSVVSEDPTEKFTTEENLEKSSVSETKTPEAEFKSTDSTVSGQSSENLTTEDKSLVEHTSTEPELSENKFAETVSSENKNAGPELTANKSPEPVLSEIKASNVQLMDKSKSPEPVNSEQVEQSKDNTSRRLSPGKSTSAIDDIDAFLQRNKSRTISRQQNVDGSSHRTLFAEIDSLIDAYGHKRQMTPSSNDHPDLAAAQIENESRAQGQQLSVQDDHLPDVIIANTKSAHRAATQIQSAYRGHRTRQQLNQDAQPRKDSEESDRTYTIDKHNGSTPDEEVLSDDDGTRNKAATKIQTTFREYHKNRSTEHSKSVEEVTDVEQKSEVKETDANEDVKMKESVEHSNKMSEENQGDKNKEMEESIEKSQDATSVNDETVEQNTSPSVSVNTVKVSTHNTDAEEKITSENAPRSLEVQQSHTDYDSLNSEPEKRHSPELGQVQALKIAKLEDKFLDHVVTHDNGSDAQHEQLRDISEITHDAAIKIQSTYRGFKTRQTLKDNNQTDRSLEAIPEVMSPTNLDKEPDTGAQGENKHRDDETMIEEHGTTAGQQVKSCEDVHVASRSPSPAEQKYKSATDHVASTSDAWRYQLLHDATTDAESTAKDESSNELRSDEDDSDSRARSPDGKLVQGYQHNPHAEQPAGLQHSGEMHDTLDIFLSSEELSQGAEVLTSRDASTKDDVSSAHARCDTAAKHEAAEQHNDHSVMESAKTQSKNNTPTTQHQHQQQQQQQAITDMGNDEAVAATKIQAGFRGYQVRKQMKLKKNGSDDAKVVKRCSSGRRRGSLRRGDNSKSGTDLEERSATKIQAGIRGFLVRKRQRSTKDKQ